MLKAAMLYKRTKADKVSCFLCSHHCLISNGKFGICNVRENREGVLYTHAYGELIAQNIDPIEKNLFTISSQGQDLFPSLLLAAIFNAVSVRIGKSLR